MTEQQVIQWTNEVFEQAFEIERSMLTADAHIFEDLGLDSLDIVDLVVALQDRFGIRIREDERIRTVETLGDLYAYIVMVGQEAALGGEG